MTTRSQRRAAATGRALAVLTALFVFAAAASAGNGPPKEKFLGPTGIFGTHSQTEFTVTKVMPGAPAEGKVAAKDVIVGVNGKKFTTDCRKQIAAAIVEAEAGANDGVVTLMLKGGKTAPVPLKVIGRYADTAPYDCELSDKIVTRAADWLVTTGSYKSGDLAVGWLGLMATGEPKYIDVVKRELPKQGWIKPDPAKCEALLRGDTDMGYVGWSWGYRCIVMAEYYLMTGDESVLPGLETYAVTLAKGQDPAGRWGHRLISEKRGGRLPGYAHINQPSMTCFVGLLLARRCGIKHPALDAAIDRSHTAFGYYVGRGALPYGNHGPYTHVYNNNGSSGSAALAMALLADSAAAEFFAHQCAAAHVDMERGHATTYFNILWTPLGANVAGPGVTQRFFDKTLWMHTLARAPDGHFTFYGGESKAGNSTGSHLLAYCLPRRALFITGKGADRSLWLEPAKAAEVVAVSEIDCNARTSDELVDLLAHPAPQIRRQASWVLRSREPDFVPRLLKLMADGTKRQKIAAIGFFGYQCPEQVAKPQLGTLGAILRNAKEDPEVRAAAANALAFYGESAYPYYQDMLRLLAEARPDDTLRIVDESLGDALVRACSQPFPAGLVKDKDKDLFYKAVDKLADHPKQSGRANAMRLLIGMPQSDFHIVGAKVLHVAQNRDRRYTSYHNPMSAVQQAVLVLAQFNVREGLDIAWNTQFTPDGKWGFKARAILTMLAGYGPYAKPYLDKINADENLKRGFAAGRWIGLYNNLVKAADDPSPRDPLVSFDQAMKAGHTQ